MSRAFFILISLFFYFSGVSYGEEKPCVEELLSKREELKSIQKEILDTKQKISRIHKEECSMLSKLKITEKSLSKSNKEVNLLDPKVDKLSNKLESTEKKISGMEENLRKGELRLNAGLMARYRLGEKNYRKALFSSCSNIDMLRYCKLLSVALNHDLDFIAENKRDLSALQGEKRQIEGEETRLVLLRADKERKRLNSNTEYGKKTRSLRSFEAKKQTYIASVKELEKHSKRLQSVIEELESERSLNAGKGVPDHVDEGFATLRGKLSAPVSGEVQATFGRQEDPTLNTFAFNNGIDIIAPWGSEVRSVYDGKVLFSDWFKGYGKIVIISHADSYYTLFAHISKLMKKTGDTVKKGEIVALVGDTDSFRGPCLYFEIRYHDKPENPLEWLSLPVVR